jgi:hypothetical protein
VAQLRAARPAGLLTLATHGSSYVIYMLPAVVVFGLGLAITVAPLTATAMSSAPAELSGIASAVNNDVARFGGLLAVAVLPALAGITGTAYPHPDALAAGFRTAALISGAACAAGGVARRDHDHQPRTGAPPRRRPSARGMPPLRPRRATTDYQPWPDDWCGITTCLPQTPPHLRAVRGRSSPQPGDSGPKHHDA